MEANGLAFGLEGGSETTPPCCCHPTTHGLFRSAHLSCLGIFRVIKIVEKTPLR